MYIGLVLSIMLINADYLLSLYNKDADYQGKLMHKISKSSRKKIYNGGKLLALIDFEVNNLVLLMLIRMTEIIGRCCNGCS